MSMEVGKRIRFFRRLRGMTQKELGKAVGFSSRTASVRIAQYEIGARTPRPELMKQISEVLNVSEDALTTPDLENVTCLMHTLFALEDACFFHVLSLAGNIELWSDIEDDSIPLAVRVMLKTWAELREKYMHGDISKEKYNQWRYNFPNIPKNESEMM
ncbi:MAG: helix-turn-helix domain-containing protein [Oscillospiraceae bacterium]|nr:helix-turn-helix domain-containing protein [Oscillospiraceae bacterium]